MAQVRRNVLATRNQENATFVGKSSVGNGHPAPTTKRTALVEIGNDVNRGRALATKKPLQKAPPVEKEKNAVVTTNNSVTVRPRPALRKAASTTCVPEPIEDIDKDDKEDPFMVGEYVNEIYDYLRQMEAKYPIKEDHLAAQCEVTSKMRAVLVDWLVDVHMQFHLLQETLYLTVAIIDRYLQEVLSVTRKKLQLVGVGAMYVACKYEEMYAPEVSDFVYICDNTYNKEEILRMEAHIVKTLQFSFSRPLPLHFLRRYSKAAHAMVNHHQMAKYIIELSLVEYDLCHYPPSRISAAAMYLALWMFRCEKTPVWTRTLVHYTTYTYKDIETIVKKLANVLLKADVCKHQAVRKKYSQSKFLKVSCMPELKSASLHKLAAS